MSQVVLTWTMSAGFLAGFVLTGYHAHVLLHLGLGHTLLAMFSFVGAVLAGLMVNLWFMAGQRYVLEFLARFEPTSGAAEWVHDTVFGISQAVPYTHLTLPTTLRSSDVGGAGYTT